MPETGPTMKIDDKEEWLRALYAETWKQYVHEDVIFYEVTRAGYRYVNARGASLRIIEAVADLGPYGPATFEDLWREKSEGKNPDTKITVLCDNMKLQTMTSVWVYNFKGGLPFLYEVAAVFGWVIWRHSCSR